MMHETYAWLGLKSKGAKNAAGFRRILICPMMAGRYRRGGGMPMTRHATIFVIFLGLGLMSAASVAAVTNAPSSIPPEGDVYEFAPPPGENWNRLYRVNRQTGEVGACQFIPKENSIGTTLCFPAGEGAGPQAKGEYGLVASKLALEGGIYRVNKKTGEMSVCFIIPEKVVCTDPSF
jgi:hypothetical protein